jgi:TRAP-type C4-dicarboxylate transport system permease large subunit
MVFTPIEAAAVAAVYAFFITVFVYKELRLSMRYARFHFAVSGSSPERANQVSITAGNLATVARLAPRSDLDRCP